MKRQLVRYIYAGAASLVWLPGVASAQTQAYTATLVNVRAGPAGDYPVVAQLGGGAPVTVMGCISNYQWCDVALPNLRGWVYAGSLSYPYQGANVPLMNYATVIGLPVVTFSLGAYWNDYYRGRPWYRDQSRWAHHAPPPPPRPGAGRPPGGPQGGRPPINAGGRPPGGPPPGHAGGRPPGPGGPPPGNAGGRPPGPGGPPPGNAGGRPPGPGGPPPGNAGGRPPGPGSPPPGHAGGRPPGPGGPPPGNAGGRPPGGRPPENAGGRPPGGPQHDGGRPEGGGGEGGGNRAPEHRN